MNTLFNDIKLNLYDNGLKLVGDEATDMVFYKQDFKTDNLFKKYANYVIADVVNQKINTPIINTISVLGVNVENVLYDVVVSYLLNNFLWKREENITPLLLKSIIAEMSQPFLSNLLQEKK